MINIYISKLFNLEEIKALKLGYCIYNKGERNQYMEVPRSAIPEIELRLLLGKFKLVPSSGYNMNTFSNPTGTQQINYYEIGR